MVKNAKKFGEFINLATCKLDIFISQLEVQSFDFLYLPFHLLKFSFLNVLPNAYILNRFGIFGTMYCHLFLIFLFQLFYLTFSNNIFALISIREYFLFLNGNFFKNVIFYLNLKKKFFVDIQKKVMFFFTVSFETFFKCY